MERDLFDDSFATIGKGLRSRIKDAKRLDHWFEVTHALQAQKRDYHQRLEVLVRETFPQFLGPKKAALQSEFQKVLAEHLKQHVEGWQPHIDGLRLSVTAKDSPTDMGAVLKFLRLQEIRQELKSLDPILLAGEYRARCQDSSGQHDDWLEAVETAPTPMLAGEIIDQGRAGRSLRALSPEVRQQIGDLTELQDATKHLVHLLSREMPETQADPIAEMAGRREGSGDDETR